LWYPLNHSDFKFSSSISIDNMAFRRVTKKPFCKVCCDAGKPEAEYTSHWVKSKPGDDGVVVCPTLLKQCCGYCDGLGHTPAFCKVLANDKKYREKEEHFRERERRRREYKEATQSKKAPAVSSSRNFGGFSALRDDSPSPSPPRAEPKKGKKQSEEFPSLTNSVPASDRKSFDGYANACVNAELEASKKEIEKLKAQLSGAKKMTILTPLAVRPFVSPKACNWEDYDDDSDKEEDEKELVQADAW